MKKISSIIILFSMIMVSLPLDVNAITQSQIDAEVQIVCTDGNDNWLSGSGTIIDPKGIILTNRHVIEGALNDTCFIGFIVSIDEDPNFYTGDKLNLAEVKYKTNSSDMDAAVLYLDNNNSRKYPYINIWDSSSNNLRLGSKIEAIGYPGIGGPTITYTSGDFSGYGSSVNGMQNFIKTTAMLEHGNSGGAAYDESGGFIGIPTRVIKGELGSLGYILSVNSIKSWLSNKLGGDYKQKVVSVNPEIENKSVIIQNDITPPRIDRFFVGLYGMDDSGKEIFYGGKFGDDTKATYEFSKIRFGFKENCSSDICINDESGDVKGYYYYFGTNPNAVPLNDGAYIKATDLLDHNTTEVSKVPEIFVASPGERNYFILQAQDKSNNISNPIINFEYILEGDAYKDIKSIDIHNYNDDLLGNLRFPTFDERWAAGGYSFERNGYRIWSTSRIYTRHKTLFLYPDYGYPTEGLTYHIDRESWWKDVDTKKGVSTLDNFIKVENIDVNKNTHIYIKPNENSSEDFTSSHRILEIIYDPSLLEDVRDVNFTIFDEKLVNSLKGRILLQVEAHGEAYYVNPRDTKGYYMADGNEAYRIMRYLGVGITNKDLDKVKADSNFAKQHSGKIFLQVEANGEAFYIDVDGNAHYLKDGEAAYGIMRDLGLGITNNDLNKIIKGSL